MSETATVQRSTTATCKQLVACFIGSYFIEQEHSNYNKSLSRFTWPKNPINS